MLKWESSPPGVACGLAPTQRPGIFIGTSSLRSGWAEPVLSGLPEMQAYRSVSL